jgi:hypothetical protein
MITRLKQGQTPLLDSQWNSIYVGLEHHCKHPQSYILSEETGLLSMDENLLLADNSIQDEEITTSIRVFNTFVTESKSIIQQLIHKINTSKETNELLSCLLTVQNMTITQLQHNTQGYKCQFTGELSAENFCIQFLYMHNNQYKKSAMFAVCERYKVWLQSLYVMIRIVNEIQTRIQQKKFGENKEKYTSFCQSMNHAIQFAWEFVFPVRRCFISTNSVSLRSK